VIFRLLGPFEITRESAPAVCVTSARVRAVAATLLLGSPQRFPVTSLFAALWDEPPPSAEANLRTYLAMLRRVLGRCGPAMGGRLVTSRGGGSTGRTSYRLEVAPDESDLGIFRDLSTAGSRALRDGRFADSAGLLSRALGLWRGAAGVDVCGSTHLQHRLDALDEQRVTVREQCLAARLALGDAAGVVVEAREVLAAHPLRERCWGHLLRALYLNGDISAALDAYRRAQAVLDEQLGVAPSAELQRLHRAMLRRDELIPPYGV
jgi:DNA-binding SARP family transcriptional activator